MGTPSPEQATPPPHQRPVRGWIVLLIGAFATVANSVDLTYRGVSCIFQQDHTLYTAVDLSGAIAIVVGTERQGLTDTWLHAADVQVKLPMLGQANSLNVAMAATLLIYEVVRQRGASARRRVSESAGQRVSESANE